MIYRYLISMLCFFLYLSLNGQVQFVDVSETAGVKITGFNSGIAAGDYDNDGDEDVFVSVANGPNLLFENIGNGNFNERATAAGLAYTGPSYCSVWGDLDNDGDLDLYVGNRDERNLLYINKGDGTFNEIAASAFVDTYHKPRSIMLADIDNDGWLDIYIANFNEENQLFRNNQNLTFTNIVLGARVSDWKQSMGAVFFDYDNDGDQDLYLTRDANKDYVFYENDGNGFFTDKSVESGLNYVGQGMGLDVGDINNDGFLDVYVSNLFDNVLFLNKGDGTFEDITATAGVADYGMGWGTSFLDFDNDGWLDIYVVNDSYFSPYPNILYRNKGDNSFEVVGANTPIASMFGAYGMVVLDADLDGRLDVFIGNNSNDGNQLILNKSGNTGNWFKVRARAKDKNIFAIGSRVEVYAGGRKYIDDITAGSGYSSQHSSVLHFGIGTATRVDSLQVKWADGRLDWYYDLPVNELFEARQQESTATDLVLLEDTFFRLSPNPFGSSFYIDFDLENTASLEMELYDALGNCIFRKGKIQHHTGAHQVKIDILSNSPKGVYFLKIRTAEGQVSKRLLKL